MLERIASNGVRCIIAESPDRFARDLTVQLTGHDFLRSLGIALIPVTAPDFFTEDTPTAVLIRQVLGAMAQFEKTSLVAKLKAARDRKKAATGKCGGRRSYFELARMLWRLTGGGNRRCSGGRQPGAPEWPLLRPALELHALVAFAAGVLGPDVDRENLVRFEQSGERILGDGLFVPAVAPFGPWTAVDFGQLIDEPFRGDLVKVTYDVPDRCESFLEQRPMLWRLLNWGRLHLWEGH
jgi:hypothetical protein